MADVDIAVDSGDLKAAIQLLNEYGQSFTGMVNKVQTESNKLARASKATASQIEQAFNNSLSKINNDKLAIQAKQEAQILRLREQNWKQFFESYGKSQVGLNGAPRNASDSALLQMLKDEEEQAKINAQSLKQLEQEKIRLTATYNPLLAAQRQYEQSLQEINRATDIGILDAQQQAAALSRLDVEYKALASGVHLAGSRFNQFGDTAVRSGKGAQMFGYYAQQAGYQVGDFAVQLQSGANAGVAFSQQAAQLAGLIPGLAGALTTFAAIGVGLLIQNLSKGEKQAEDTYLQLSKFSDLEQVFSSVGSSFETSMTQSLSRVRQEYGAFVADMAKFQLQNELDTLKGNLSTVMREATTNDPTASAGWFGRNIQLGGSNGDVDAARAAAQAAKDYNDILVQVQAAQDRLFGGDINSKDELVSVYRNVYETIEAIPGISDTILDRFKQVAEEAGIWAEVQKQIGDEISSTNDRSSHAFQLYKDMNNELRLSNDLARVKARYGEESIQYLNAEKNQSLDILRTELERSGMADTLVQKIMAQVEAQIEFEQAAQRSALVVDQLIIDLSAMSGIDISGVFTRAQGAANSLLGTVRSLYTNMAAFTAEQNIRIQQSVQSNPLDPLGAFNGGQSASGKVQIAAGGVIRSPVMPDWVEPTGGGGSSGKGGGKPKLSDAEKEFEKSQDKLKEFFEQYNLNIKQQERLLGVQGQQREELEKIIEIENRLGEARTMVSQAQIEAMAREELALESKLQREVDIYNLGKSNVENLLTTVVDGTASIEDAFKGMLRNILLEVYQQYVAKGAADMAGNFAVSLLSAKGNAFGAGGVKMFAKGGVVDSPTLFGYGGNKTGMMGEAGPEAIMPLKRNTQGQLGVAVSGGSSTPIIINHSFNIQANGDESVNRIIQSHIPRITEASKRAVLDAKRRGQNGFR